MGEVMKQHSGSVSEFEHLYHMDATKVWLQDGSGFVVPGPLLRRVTMSIPDDTDLRGSFAKFQRVEGRWELQSIELLRRGK
jgi:hypothetical protein